MSLAMHAPRAESSEKSIGASIENRVMGPSPAGYLHRLVRRLASDRWTLASGPPVCPHQRYERARGNEFACDRAVLFPNSQQLLLRIPTHRDQQSAAFGQLL